MARLADRIWDLEWVPPQLVCCRPESRDRLTGFGAARLDMEQQRDLIAASAVFDGDAPADFFFRTAMGDRDLRFVDFPALAVPGEAAFLEFRRPRLSGLPLGPTIAANLPARWGWLVKRSDPAFLAELFGNQLELRPGAVDGLACTLWFTPTGGHFTAPAALVGIQLAADGSPLGPPAFSLGFNAAGEQQHYELPRLFGYFNALLTPAVVALAFLACRSTTVRTVEPPPRLARARSRRGRRPLVAAREVDCSAVQGVLRHEGLAGVQGLAAALRKCRHHFVRDLRSTST